MSKTVSIRSLLVIISLILSTAAIYKSFGPKSKHALAEDDTAFLFVINRVPIEVEIESLFAEYDRNPIRAAEKWDHKYIIINGGVINDFIVDAEGIAHPSIAMQGDDFPSSRLTCSMDKHSRKKPEALAVNVGQVVRISGVLYATNSLSVIMSSCRIISEEEK